MKKSKQILSILLAVLMVALSVPVTMPLAAENNTDPAAEAELLPASYVLGGYKNSIPRDENGNTISTAAKKAPKVKTSLPSSYDSRTKNVVTSVKNQSPYGTCWAFSTMAVLESQLVKTGKASLSGFDLSEDHLVWVLNDFNEDLQDGVVSATSSDYAYDSGGSWIDSTTILSNWWGVEKEANAPYLKGLNGGYSSSDRTNSYYRLTNVNLLARSNEDLFRNKDEIKSKIMELGAVQVGYYVYRDETGYSKYESSTKNPKTYYLNDEAYRSRANHAVTIVGWDDSFSSDKFSYRPAGNGAWLIKNSWGTDYGDAGYMWISYYDYSLCDAVTYEAVPVSESPYDHVYSYNSYGDLKGNKYNNGSLQYANTFKAAGEETLQAVGLWTFQDDVKYTINIYRGLPSSGLSTSGTPASTISGTAAHGGYHILPLSSGIQLAAGERYAVTVSAKANSHSYLMGPFELDGGKQSYHKGKDTRSISFHSNRNESYIYANNQWVDVKDCSSIGYTYDLNNARLNAYTTDTEDDIFFRVSPASVNLKVGESQTISFISNVSAPVSADIKEVRSFCTVTAGNGTATLGGTAPGSGNIYATMTYNGKEYNATVPVTVSQPNVKTLTGISIKSMPTKTSYQIGESFSSSGLSIVAAYSDGSTADVTSRVSLSGFSSATAGAKTITVTYTEGGYTKNATFTVNVVPNGNYGVSFSPSSVTMQEGEKVTVTVTTNPANGSFSYQKNGLDSVCSVSMAYGNSTKTLELTGLSAGSGSVICSIIVNGVTYTGTLPITVTPFDGSDYTYSVNGANATITGYKGTESRLNIPATIGGYTVTEIAERAIFDTAREQITEVVIPNTVTKIGLNAFSSCKKLTKVTLSNSLKTMDGGAFSSCSALTSISIPASVTDIGQQCFSDCTALSSVTLNEGNQVLNIGHYAFLNCTKLKRIDIPFSKVSIGGQSLGYSYDYSSGTFGSTGLTIRGYTNSPAYEYYQANSDTVQWATLGKTLQSITVDTKPSKLEYQINETFTSAGAVITAHYSDGSTQNVTSSCTFSGYNKEKEGAQTITVTYQGQTATFTVVVVNPSNDPTFAMANVNATAGSTVRVPVTVSNNHGICTAKLSISYDKNLLELVKAENGTVITEGFTPGGTVSAVPYTVLWNSATNLASGNGTLVTFVFKVKAGVSTGTKADITLDYDYEDTLDINLNPTWFRVVSGSITVGTNRVPGDANGDGNVTLLDVALISRYLAGGWDVTINESYADVDGSGTVTLKDVALISRHLAGGWNVTLI